MERRRGGRAGIRHKILLVVLGMSVVSLTAYCAATFWGLFSIRAQMEQSSARLGEFASENSSAFLEREAVDKLMTKALGRAKFINERLSVIAKDAVYFADLTTEIYKNSGKLFPVPVPYSMTVNSGALTMQLKSVGGPADHPRIRREAELLGNITSAFISNSSDMGEIVISLYLGTESGFSVKYDAFSNDDNATFDPRARPWYIGAKERGGAYWTAPYIDASSGKSIVSVACPFYGPDGKIRGVAGIDVAIAGLNSEIVNADVGEGGYAFVVDSAGKLISSRWLEAQEWFDEAQNAFLENNPWYDDVMNKVRHGSGGFERVATASGERFMAYSPIEETGWSVVTVLPVEEIMALVVENSAAIERMTMEAVGRVNTTIRFMLAFFVLMFALAVSGIAYLSGKLSGKITNPIVTLESVLERIAGGELDTRIDIRTGDEIERLGGSVNRMAASLKEHIDDLQRVTSEKERIGAELNVATKIQASMLPCIFPPYPHRTEFDIYALMRPAREVGGDFYDFFFIDNNTLAMIVADVSGKGVPAALFMVIAKTLIKNNAQSGKRPGEIFESVNNMLSENNEAGMFVTAFMGFLDIPSGKFTYVNAGHNPPALRSGGRYELLKVKPGFVLAGMEGIKYAEGEITLQKGGELFLYTDGVTEAMNNGKAMFGEKRMIEAVNKYSALDLREFAESVKGEIEKFTDGAEQADDITMLALRYRGGDMDELLIEAVPENLSRALVFVEERLNAAGFPAKQLKRVSIVVEEIFVNIANYAYAPEKGMAALRVSVAGEEAIIAFEDSGKPYNPLEKKDPDIRAGAEEREVGGLGIYMVKNMVDAAHYRREGDKNIFTVRKRLAQGDG
ncbi:MAG: SpoIIE family protein phosphatase [Chitinispirillia bacterium]|nr:SpoIIE family protein phosphatase [Chitinispirillia bacterium]MCL2268973.1 SpoIIE family protein phosphatase [Chitinispirillia bacterium]